MKTLDLSASKQWGGSQGRLLVTATCACGDIFEQSRFIPLLEKRGDWVLYCDPPLVGLFERHLSIGRVVSTDNPVPDHDFWTPIQWVHEGVGAKPLTTPPFQFTALPEKIKQYEFLRKHSPVIGMTWQAAEQDVSYHSRKLTLEEIARIQKAFPQVTWVNLQHHQYHPDLMYVDFETWEDTAGLIHNLDGVLSCDTSVPHLSGSMGKKTIVLHGRAQTSLTQHQPFETLYPNSVKMFTPDYGNPSSSKTATQKFLEHGKQNPEFWKF